MRPAILSLMLLVQCLWTTRLTAQQGVQPADADRPVSEQPVEAAKDAVVPIDDSDAKSALSAVEFPPRSLQTAVNQLPEAFRNNPANGEVLSRLSNLDRPLAEAASKEMEREHLHQQAKDASALIIPAIPPELHLPLARQAARYLAQLHRDSHDVPEWQAKALADLEQLETRLAREFPTRIELASQVGIERLWCQLYSLPPEQQNESNPDSPQVTSEFIERYPHTEAAARAAYLAATQYERWALAHLGPNDRPRDDVPEMDEDYFQQAVEQSPNSIWGKAAAGALRRIRLVGQTLDVSGKSAEGKPLSLNELSGKRAVVIFFRPGKFTSNTAENPVALTPSFRQRGFEVLGVLCHSPTASPEEIDNKFIAPKAPAGIQFPCIVDTDDFDSSYSVRFGLTVPRLFVLVDETGKVVRTQQSEIENLDEFLGLPIDPLAASAIPPENTTQVRPPATTQNAGTSPQPSDPAADPPQQAMKIFHLQHGVAADYSKLLQDIFTGTKLTADPRTNSIIAAGGEQDLLKIEALLLKLDEAKSRPAAPNGSATATEMPKSQRNALAFTATWAGPCQQILPVLRSIADLGAPIQFVDVDREPELAKRHQITSIPAVIVEEDGREVERLVGVASRQKLEKLILGRVVTSPDAPAAPGRSVAAATSDDPFAAPQGFAVPLPTPSRSQPPGLLVLESRAAELAGKVRELSKTQGSEHPELIAARQQLERTLAEALELKFRSEEQQVAALEHRLLRLKSQLDQRQAVQGQIVERRMRELLENPITDWDSGPAAPGRPARTSSTAEDQRSQLTAAQQADPIRSGAGSRKPGRSTPRDLIIIDLFADSGRIDTRALLAELARLPRVGINARSVPNIPGTADYAIIHDSTGRLQKEAQETGKESATREAIQATLAAAGIKDIRWEEPVATETSSSLPERTRTLPSPSGTTPAAGEAAAGADVPPPFDKITVDLYANFGIYQNQQLLGAVVAPLNKIPQVVVNVRIVPGDGGKFVFAIVRNTSRRFQSEETENGGMSPTRRAIEAALKGGGINNVRWEGAAEEVASEKFLPSNGEAATGVAPASVSSAAPARKPAESLESSGRLALDLAEAEADIRETEEKLAYQTKLHAKGVVAIDEVTSAMQQRDRAVRRRQILLDEYRATVKDLELQLASAKTEYDGAVTNADQVWELFHLARVSMREVTDARVRRDQSNLALQRLQNRLELLKKVDEDLIKFTNPNNPAKSPAVETPAQTIDILPQEKAPPQTDSKER